SARPGRNDVVGTHRARNTRHRATAFSRSRPPGDPALRVLVSGVAYKRGGEAFRGYGLVAVAVRARSARARMAGELSGQHLARLVGQPFDVTFDDAGGGLDGLTAGNPPRDANDV